MEATASGGPVLCAQRTEEETPRAAALDPWLMLGAKPPVCRNPLAYLPFVGLYRGTAPDCVPGLWVFCHSFAEKFCIADLSRS